MSKVINIIGAGLCGSLLAIRLVQRGYSVKLFEKRPDMRQTDISAGRSINLALSDRGFKALRMIGLEEDVRSQVIPMYGRMIHDQKGNTSLIRYSGREGEYINSVSREGLNIALLNRAEQEGIPIEFEAACKEVNLRKDYLRFSNPNGKDIKTEAGIVIGSDGAGSAIRNSLFKRSNQLRFNFSQQFLEHGYKELEIPGTSEGGFRIEKNALHIWPRGGFMVIALPNLDGSFTVTLFLAFHGNPSFDGLKSDAEVLNFFEEYFPDLLEHMPDLLQDYKDNPESSLGTIKCHPWHIGSKLLLMGDAAHAIVPFYGQGMNAAFEDCVVLDQCIERFDGDWGQIFDAYEKARKINTDAIADLAVDNFFEMRDHVADPIFVKKRRLELRLEQERPAYYSKYSLVTFREDLPYRQAMDLGRAQDKVLMDICETHEDVENLSLDWVMDVLNEKIKD